MFRLGACLTVLMLHCMWMLNYPTGPLIGVSNIRRVILQLVSDQSESTTMMTGCMYPRIECNCQHQSSYVITECDVSGSVFEVKIYQSKVELRYNIM